MYYDFSKSKEVNAFMNVILHELFHLFYVYVMNNKLPCSEGLLEAWNEFSRDFFGY